jgi:hypothetical protein
MTPAPAQLPGFWRFLWLFFMQPITLHRLLRSVEVNPRQSPWKLLRRQRSPQENWWIARSAQALLVFTPGLILAVAGVFLALGLKVVWFGVALGVAFGVVVGVVFGVSFGVAVGTAHGVVLGVVSGVVLGDVAANLFREGSPFAAGVAIGAAACGASLVVANDIANGVAFGEVVGAAGVVAGGVTFLAAFFRIPALIIEVILQTAARYRSATGSRSLHWVPVLYHNLSYLPHPFLSSHILAEADVDPALTRRVLDACSIAPGQRRTGRKVEAKLRAQELKRLAEAQDFQAIQELRGLWLPGLQGADGLLLSFSEAARYPAAATAVFNPHHRLRHLQGFAQQSNAIENQLRASRDAFTQPFEGSLQALQAVYRQMRAEAEMAAAGLILNPFRAGDPLSDAEGPELFRGREAAVREIEAILSDATRSASLLLLAPRRAGKTSLLKMLPRLLPDTICIFFDLQAHPVASAGAFWNKLAEQARIQAKLERRVDLPALPEGPPMEAAAQWLEKLDQLPRGRRVLIAIDEFERLQDLFPGSRQEFLQLMGLFRATIQHRRGVRLLVSGAAPFDELDGVWDDHFISVRQIKLPFLNLADSVGLLTQPSPDFPSGTIPEEVAVQVYVRTGGQPFLLQVYGSLLVTRLNEEKRQVATLADVGAVELRAIEWAEPYFREAYRTAPEPAREALGRLSHGQAIALSTIAQRWLTQRYLLTPGGQLAIPVFGAWIAHHALV